MRASRYIARRRLTREWRSLLPICLLTGLAGAVTLGALVGGLRTASALDRMEESSKPYDAWVQAMSTAFDPGALEQMRALPMVTSVSGVFTYTLGPPAGFANVHDLRWNDLAVVVMDGGALTQFARPVISEGRLPDPDSRNEVLVQQSYADAHNVHVGDTIPVKSFSEAEASLLWVNGDSDIHALTSDPTFGTPHLLAVSGIGSMQDSLVTYAGSAPFAFIGGPGLAKVLGWDTATWASGALLRLRDPTQMPAVREALARMLPDQIITYQTWSATRSLAARAIRPVAVLLWIFAAALAVIGLILVGHALARCFTLDVRRNHTLSALGLTHVQRMIIILMLILAPIAVGGVLAIAGAFATSALTPIGPARAAEVSPGLQWDRAFLVGGIIWCATIFLMSIVPAWRSTRLTSHEGRSEGSRLAARLTEWGVAYPIPIGVRFAFEPGRSATAVPTRSTLAGAVLGGLVSTLVLTFVASLDAAIAQPDRYGVNFDGAILYTNHGGGTWQPLDDIERPLLQDPGVAETGMLRINEVTVDSGPLMALAFSGPGDLGPTIVAGRMPAAVDEVALGQVTFRQLNASLGGRVRVNAPGFSGDARVVGVAVLPSQGYYSTSDATAPGVGAVVDGEALGPFDPGSVWLATYRTRPGVSASEVDRRVENAAIYPFEALGLDFVWPQEVQTLRNLRVLPLALGAMALAVMAGMGVYGLSFAIRGRRRDLTVLRILGIRDRGLRLIGATHGVTVVAFGALIGIPLGLAIGRWSWTWLATQLGLVATPEVNLAAVMWLACAEAILAALSGAFAVGGAPKRMANAVLRDD